MNETRNPYSPPVADVADPQPHPVAEGLIPNGRRVPIGNGAKWLGDAFRLYFQSPWKWIGVLLLFFVISIASAFIPLSSVLWTVLWPVLCGGLMFAVHSQRQTGFFTIGNMFAGFGPRFAPLAIVGAVMLVMYPILYVTILVFVDADVASAMILGGADLDPSRVMNLDFLLAMLIYLLIALPVGAATYLAPPLVMLHDMKPGEAIKMSFIAAIKNILPSLLFGVLIMLVILVSVIPFALGLLISLPVAMITIYTMYRDIFVEQS